MPKKLMSNRDKARKIVSKIYEDANVSLARKTSIAALISKLKMEKTTAATYHENAIKHFRTIDQAAAEAKAEKGKVVWSSYKVGTGKKSGVVSSVGLFTTRKAAKEFNEHFRHSGVVKGIVEVNSKVA